MWNQANLIQHSEGLAGLAGSIDAGSLSSVRAVHYLRPTFLVNLADFHRSVSADVVILICKESETMQRDCVPL